MPRHPVGDKAMTGAERLRRWRERKPQERGPAPEADRSASEALSKASEALSNARQEIASLREQLPAAAAEPSSQDLIEARQEIDRLRQRVAALEDETATLRIALEHERKEHAATKAKAARSALPPTDGDDPRIARLTKANRELRGKLRYMQQFYEEESRNQGVMPFTTYTKVMRCLHPDQPTPTPERRQEACGLLSQWKQAANRAQRRAR